LHAIYSRCKVQVPRNTGDFYGSTYEPSFSSKTDLGRLMTTTCHTKQIRVETIKITNRAINVIKNLIVGAWTVV